MAPGRISLRHLFSKMNAKIIAWYVGIALLLVSALMIVSGIIAFHTPGDASRTPLLFSAFLTGIVGAYPFIFIRNGSHKLNFREANCIVVVSWVFCCFFGMLPYLFYGEDFSFVNALFESVSGFTTTGASILTDIEALPRGLQFWRISTAWVGGIGIVTLFSRLMFGHPDQSTLSGSTISFMARQGMSRARSEYFANRILVIYIILTLVTSGAMKLTGLGWFDAVTTAMSACSTCGFCNGNASIASFGNPAAEVVLTVAMLVSGINFSLIFLTFVRGSRNNVFKSEVIRVFLALVGICTLLVTTDLLSNGGYRSVGTALRDAAFQVASIATTTGFATQDTTLWPPLSMGILIICSVICGCSGSTSGGIKMDRVILAVKGIGKKIRNFASPSAVYTIRLDKSARSEQQVGDAYAFIFCYLGILAIGALVNAACGLDFTTGFTASIACIGNVGPGFGDVGSMANYGQFPVLLKISGMLEMLIGRLEIFPILYLLPIYSSPAPLRRRRGIAAHTAVRC